MDALRKTKYKPKNISTETGLICLLSVFMPLSFIQFHSIFLWGKLNIITIILSNSLFSSLSSNLFLPTAFLKRKLLSFNNTSKQNILKHITSYNITSCQCLLIHSYKRYSLMRYRIKQR